MVAEYVKVVRRVIGVRFGLEVDFVAVVVAGVFKGRGCVLPTVELKLFVAPVAPGVVGGVGSGLTLGGLVGRDVGGALWEKAGGLARPEGLFFGFCSGMGGFVGFGGLGSVGLDGFDGRGASRAWEGSSLRRWNQSRGLRTTSLMVVAD
jgi:hypothetical protein